MGASIRVIFRADASSTIGSGHIMRCLTLAEALRGKGMKVSFICRDLPGNYSGWLRARGYDVHLLPAPVQPLPAGQEQYLYWLGVPLELDIEQCNATIAAMPTPDWIVVDHYALDARWETAIRERGSALLAIDDIANRSHDCDLLLDQNYYPDAPERYLARVSLDASLLLGPTHALLRPAFHASRRNIRYRKHNVRKILVFMGGSDNANVTSTVLRALSHFMDKGMYTEVIAGQSNPHLEEVRSLCAATGAKLLTQVDDMAERMVYADLAIGATGVSTWERACVGLPSLAVSVAENQHGIGRNAHELGILRWLGDAHEVSEQDWVDALAWAFSNPEALRAHSENGMRLVDGLGTKRVMENMIGHHRRMH